MKRFLLLLASFVLAVLALGSGLEPPVRAQGIQPPTSVNFRNETPIPIIVQGISFIGGTVRKGQPLFIPAGRNAWDTNVPPGPRHYKVYDGSQPSKVLNPSVPVQILNRDLFLLVRPLKGGTVEVMQDVGG